MDNPRNSVRECLLTYELQIIPPCHKTVSKRPNKQVIIHSLKEERSENYEDLVVYGILEIQNPVKHIVMLLTKAWLDTSWALYWNSDIFGPLSTSNPMMTEYVSWEKALFFLPMERGAAKLWIILKLLYSPNCSFS